MIKKCKQNMTYVYKKAQFFISFWFYICKRGTSYFTRLNPSLSTSTKEETEEKITKVKIED